MSAEKLSFQAEVSRLLDIVANSLYSNKEVFLRELISNASDACDRLRYLALTQPDLLGDDTELQVRVSSDKAAKTITVTDNGIGMNRADLIENLGTIARSGTAEFVGRLGDKAKDMDLIGQFGVGFYAAFMVAKTVTVRTRKAGESEGWVWSSDGAGDFTIEEAADVARGTEITLTLKDEAEEFLEPARLGRIVRTYSDHIALPVILVRDDKEETANSASALWTRPKAEVTEEQYKEFYHHVAHAFDEPWLTIHFRAEGVIEYSVLLFVPSSPPFDLFHPERKHGVKLYVRRVFITDDCADLLPAYLRFLRGVVDSEDLALNISREMLQHNPVLAKIRSQLVKRVLAALKEKAESAPEEYATFWKHFGPVLKEGLYEDEGQRETLLGLAHFRSTHGPGLVTLADYVGRLKENQTAIFYISGDDPEAMAASPQLEGFKAKGVEVLLLTDPIDEFWLPAVEAFDGKPFKSVTRGGADLAGIKAAAGEESGEGEAAEASSGAALDPLIALFRLALQDEVKDVRASERLTESPVCLVADEGDMDMHLARLLKQHHQLDDSFKRILEVNPKHPVIRAMAARLGSNGETAALEDMARLLLDQARIVDGEPLPHPAAFSKRLSALFERVLV
jgi:molecular chaperone HtpG